MAEFIDIHMKDGGEYYVLDDHGEPPRHIGLWREVGYRHYVLRIQHDEIEKL